MSSQFLIIPHECLEAAVKQYDLKRSSHFNRCMYNHYRHLTRKHRQGWKFWKAAFAWLKCMHYEREMYKAKVDELLTELKDKNNVGINITA